MFWLYNDQNFRREHSFKMQAIIFDSAKYYDYKESRDNSLPPDGSNKRMQG